MLLILIVSICINSDITDITLYRVLFWKRVTLEIKTEVQFQVYYILY